MFFDYFFDILLTIQVILVYTMKKQLKLHSFFIMVLLSGCGDGYVKTSDHKQSMNITQNINDKNEKLSVKTIHSTHSRLISKHGNLCPRLLKKNIDSPLITRNQEHLNGKYCDYYIYPKKGQVLSISSSNSSLEITLRMPALHDFANGEYVIKNNRRHVIRVEYTSAFQAEPKDFMYDIDFYLK